MTTPAESHEAPDKMWFVTELGAAMCHLENALRLSRGPEKCLLPDGTTISQAQLRLWVDRNTSRTQDLLDRLRGLEEIALPDGTTISEAQLRLWVDQNTEQTQDLVDRLQVLLEEIAVPHA
ncbi:hypothetical protein ACPCVO_47035 [Streptomyces umbrinus]|uniref:hypothetical protein n=1 Tax=Streptomyces umbrinus TaxID=67370 RepID=UPI003C2DC287